MKQASYARAVKNIYLEFAGSAYEGNGKMLAQIVPGYEAETGTQFDWFLLMATHIGQLAHDLVEFHAITGRIQPSYQYALKKALKNLSYLKPLACESAPANRLASPG